MGGEKTADGYVSKTGFSSLNIAAPKAAVVTEKKTMNSNDAVPYEQVDNSRRRSNSKSKPPTTASLFANFNAPGAAST